MMQPTSNAPEAREQVLSTMNRDGSRRRIRPKLSKGRYHRRRRITAWALILTFSLMPILRLNGKPLMLFDIGRREFTLFGATFLPTDTFLLMLLLFSIFVGIFLVTAVLGRVWCGWACPQTVYMEFVYRPLELLVEGGRGRQLATDRSGLSARRVIKNVVFLVVSAFLANTFLAYFVGWERLLNWMTSPPTDHPAAFGVMLFTTLLMFADFGWFREQTCILVCPYGRFQSVLLDRQSLIVGYDVARGEPREKIRRNVEPSGGDCIDCGRCVATCPTGIDIRDGGLQMECVACTQCIDACDEVMARVGRPPGLVRYTSQAELETGTTTFLRPRLVVYTAVLSIMFGALAISLAGKASADVTLLRGLGAPFQTLQTGAISNQVRIKIANRSAEERSYRFELLKAEGLIMIAPENPLTVPAGETFTTAAFINADPSAFTAGELEITLRISDGVDFEKVRTYRLLGPTGS
ncbi:MAG: cytochrome c oxidase accessory protein CcoG [Thermoanaerobaculales bacterium]|jgi:cytochrome c oxidase accessory protein FixG|nr:cytochrome c oxidase accessory protein CcoG [Thermoanaerobaculales bacterium]